MLRFEEKLENLVPDHLCLLLLVKFALVDLLFVLKERLVALLTFTVLAQSVVLFLFFLDLSSSAGSAISRFELLVCSLKSFVLF